MKMWPNRLIVITAFCLAVVVAGGAGPARAGAFEDGYAAYEQGDLAKALKIWMPLAQAGHGLAQYNIGLMYEEGKGVAHNRELAVQWWLKAANNKVPQALHNLAGLYLFGPDAEHAKAVPWITKAADLGIIRSQYTLGKMYLDGLGLPKNGDKARFWIEKAAAKGLDRAQYNMGKLTRDGIAGAPDKAAAANWFLRAAKQGYAKAQNHIGMRYAQGSGVPRNDVAALMWVTLAAAQGHDMAEVNRKTLTARMSKAEIAEALRRARAFKPTAE